jgi:UDP:flavonoid glycosyltransferase YjiC (YdhE family)
MRILLAGGGSGGHVTPLRAISESIRDQANTDVQLTVITDRRFYRQTKFLFGSHPDITIRKVTEGKVTKEAIRQRKANLLFFGNFHSMTLEEFQWGVNEMLKDPEFLYSSMSRDLYFLGIVLAKKYRYLSYCYNVFMYGLIISVLAFVVSFLV